MTASADLRLLRAAVFAAVCVALSAAGHAVAAGTSVPAVSLALGFAAVLAVAYPLAGRERSLPGIAAVLAGAQFALHTLFACAQQFVAPGARPHGGSGGVQALAQSLLCHNGAEPLSDAQAHRVVSQAGLSAGDAVRQGAEGAVGQGGHAPWGAASAAPGFPDSPLDCLRDAARAALGLLDAPMLIGHLLAALVLGWLLRRGEAALWRLIRLSAELAVGAGADAGDMVAARALRAALAYVRALHAGLRPHAPVRVRFGRARDESAPPSPTLRHSVCRRGPPTTGADSLTLAA
ncbi:hypothetical protein [Streptomyces boncukensis]|uniref:Integral membrane protein n=1 Tax=Streptomyces boncukensis TaxID=2711219 RepID=A0A6G4WSM9_9ACTN|nr:hypothetical protein [Streptomyces boncukensis]NGO67554.1 hypothetical protein [Streptomyces boncukensis]